MEAYPFFPLIVLREKLQEEKEYSIAWRTR